MKLLIMKMDHPSYILMLLIVYTVKRVILKIQPKT
jgi:hypothetical protein